MSHGEWPEGFHDALMRYANARGEYFLRGSHRPFSHRQKFSAMTDEEVGDEMQAALHGLLDWFQQRSARRAELLARLRGWAEPGDPEIAHSEADKILLEMIGDQEVTNAFNAVTRWYS